MTKKMKPIYLPRPCVVDLLTHPGESFIGVCVAFGTYSDETETYSTGIIEKENGKLVTIWVDRVQFTDREE
jgi:hypothetical protein